MKRHIAKTNLDQRCVVLFMQIPGRESHALVCQTDSLPPRYEQAVMDVVESTEGQNDPTLANVLGRRLLPDTGENLMEALHTRGYLQPMPVDNLYMLPMPNMPFPLREIIEKMGGTVPNSGTQSRVVDTNAEVNKFNPFTENAQADGTSSRRADAENLIAHANILEADARNKRAEAYRMAPELAPKTTLTEAVESESESESEAPAKKTRKKV